MTALYRNISLSSGPDASVPPKARPVLSEISVNGVPIPEADILAEAQNHPAETPGAALIEAARALVVRGLLLQEAQRLGIEAQAETDGEGRIETHEDAAIRVLIEREVRVPAAREEECRRFYDNNPARFSSETICEARHILLAAPEKNRDAREAARMTAEALIAKLIDDPQAFPALAAEHSACPSRELGGNLGQLTRGSTVAEFEAALERMSEGELLSEPVESRFGFHIILMEKKIPGARLPYGHVRERISGWLEAASWSKAVAQYIAVLAGNAEIRGIDIEGAQGPLVR